MMNRWTAAGIHLLISTLLALASGALLYFLWFPPPYFVAGGARSLILVLMGVDVCIGPLLTLLVVKAGKARHLIRLDLTVIGVLQAIAFGYGLSVIVQARPVFIVGAVDRLVVVTASELSDADLAKGSQPTYRRRSWTGPVVVGARRPIGDLAATVALRALNGGKDIDQLPMFYVPIEQVREELLRHARPIDTPLAVSDHDATAAKQSVPTRIPADGRVALPIMRGDTDYIAVVRRSDLGVVTILSTPFWPTPSAPNAARPQ